VQLFKGACNVGTYSQARALRQRAYTALQERSDCMQGRQELMERVLYLHGHLCHVVIARRETHRGRGQWRSNRSVQSAGAIHSTVHWAALFSYALSPGVSSLRNAPGRGGWLNGVGGLIGRCVAQGRRRRNAPGFAACTRASRGRTKNVGSLSHCKAARRAPAGDRMRWRDGPGSCGIALPVLPVPPGPPAREQQRTRSWD
jgi:hypothetical protein